MKPLSFPRDSRKAALWWLEHGSELDFTVYGGRTYLQRVSGALVDLKDIAESEISGEPGPCRSVSEGGFSEAEIEAMEKLYGAPIQRPGKRGAKK